jgi:hypothetical protein
MRAVLLMVGVAASIAVSLSPAAGQRSRKGDDPDRLICRSLPKTGSLAGRERTCLTRAQWDEQAARQSKVGFEMQEKLRTSPSGQ